ncbi:hypothetical protein MJL33_31295, partial [Salmonella enterica subsp. enterica serovar Kentucky]|nr:hypothetical protein [Salmonella enterica subsp. enterica serovar Kentucky]
VLDTCGFKGRSQYTRWMRDIQYKTGLFSENCRISRHHTSPGALFDTALKFGVLILCEGVLLRVYEAKAKTRSYLMATVNQLVRK